MIYQSHFIMCDCCFDKLWASLCCFFRRSSASMHAVYAGGSTPTPSPRVHRKQFGYGRPVMPGYSFPHKQASPIHHKSASKDSTDSSTKETNFRDSIPAMCTALAFLCFVSNVVLPGLGKETPGLTNYISRSSSYLIFNLTIPALRKVYWDNYL